MSDGETIGAVLVTLLAVFGYGYWAILSGRGWPFRGCSYGIRCHQFFHFRKHRVPSGPSVDITMGDGTTDKLQPEVVKRERVPVDKGVYLKKNGKAHECDTPKFTWERGDTLDTQWMCPCGQVFNLVARAWKVLPRSYYMGYGERRSKPGEPGRKLSYADVLKIGNEARAKTIVMTPDSTRDYNRYEDVLMSSEEIINERVSFSWEETE